MSGRVKNLLRRAKKGDEAAACELLKIYYEDIFAYLRRLCGSNTDGEDLTQQTFLKVWSSLGSFRNRSKFSTWLHRIAYNAYIDWQRSNKNTSIECRAEQWWQECINENPGPFANAAEQQMASRLYKAVDQLDENKKHVVHLHYYQGVSLSETAKVLNISTSTVKYRLREAVKVLRAKIGTEESRINKKETISIAKGKLI